MNIFQSELAPQLIFVMGIINLVSGLFVLVTCRCIPGLKITGNLMQNVVYRTIFKYHCLVWWVFWISVVVHAVFALGFIGIPF